MTRSRRERGAAAVEFAIIATVFFGLLFGVIQFGIILSQQVSLNGAVRSGARFGSVNAYAGTHSCAAVIQEVRDSAMTVGIDPDDVSVQVMRSGTLMCDSGAPNATAPCTNPSASVMNPDILTVRAEFTSNFLVPLPVGGNSIDLASEGSYQCEYNS